ncbi:MAG: hypothetical protein RJB66_343 [Pseudomonadota bacterium]|jgi:hypothetical protein
MSFPIPKYSEHFDSLPRDFSQIKITEEVFMVNPLRQAESQIETKGLMGVPLRVRVELLFLATVKVQTIGARRGTRFLHYAPNSLFRSQGTQALPYLRNDIDPIGEETNVSSP